MGDHTSPSTPPGTRLLLAWQREGASDALDQLFALLYDELLGMAERQQSEAATLDAQALVHEAYLRLVNADEVQVTDRAHFLALAARVMRQVTINYAKHKARQKRGGGWLPVTLQSFHSATQSPIDTLLTLDAGLAELSAKSTRLAQVAEYKLFGGLETKEIACVLETSGRTVEREWTRAKAYLVLWMEA